MNRAIVVEVAITFDKPASGTPDEFEAFLDLAMDELDKIGRDDVDLTANLSRHEATFTIIADSIEDVSLDEFDADMRTALHAAGCVTAGWENARFALTAKDLVDA